MTSLRGRLWRIGPNTVCPLLAEPTEAGRRLETLVTGVTGRILEDRGDYVRVKTQAGWEGYLARKHVQLV